MSKSPSEVRCNDCPYEFVHAYTTEYNQQQKTIILKSKLCLLHVHSVATIKSNIVATPKKD